MDESHLEKIARTDENVRYLMRVLPLIQSLDRDSAVNKRDHKVAITVTGMVIFPFFVWLCRRLGFLIP